MKHWDLARLLHHGTREIVNVDHDPKFFLSPAVSRSEFPH